MINLAAAAPMEVQIKPWQRLAVLMYVNGAAFADIELQIPNVSYRDVSDFLISDTGKDLIRGAVGTSAQRIADLISASAIDSVLTLCEIRDKGKSETARVSAACQLLDRQIGKLKASGETRENRSKRDRSTDSNAVRAEIDRLQKELAQGI